MTPPPDSLERAKRDAWERDKDIASAFDHPNGRVAYRNLQEAHGLGFAAGWEARRGEIDALKEALRNARSYIPRGPRVDESDLLADIARLLGEVQHG